MVRPRSETLTQRETQIMEVLWDRGEATADEIRKALPDDPHDSTVRTLLRVLKSKGYVTHRARGKAYIYCPAVERAQVERRAVSSVLKRFFGGSPEALVLRLIEDEQLTPDQLDELRRATERDRESDPAGGAS